MSALFLIGDIKLLGPSNCENTRRLSYSLGAEQTIPLILTVFQRDDDSDLLYVLICAPRFDYMNVQNGPEVHMLMDALLSKVRVPVTDMPEDRADWPGFLLSTMARLQKTDEITLRAGSIDDLKVLLQDASDLLQRRIDVLCAISDDLEPTVFIDQVQPTLRHTIKAMVSYFHPVAAEAPNYVRWLEDRSPRTFGLFRSARDFTSRTYGCQLSPQDLPGDQRTGLEDWEESAPQSPEGPWCLEFGREGCRRMTKLSQALREKQNHGIDFEAGSLSFPYPGHEGIFLDALRLAREAAKPAGGLVAFSVTDYEVGGMNLEISARRYRDAVVSEFEKIAAVAKERTLSTCTICGRPGKPKSLEEPERAMVAACDGPAHSLDETQAVFNAGMC